MDTQRAIGKLEVTLPEQINEATAHNIWLASYNNSFYAFTSSALWDIGVLKINSERYVKDGQQAAIEFISKLTSVLSEPGIPELGLKGELTLVTTGENIENTVIHHILVKDNQVLHAQASLKWENYTAA